MSVMHELRSWVDASVGNAGAVRNCRRELDRRRQIDLTVDRLAARVDEPAPTPLSAETA